MRRTDAPFPTSKTHWRTRVMSEQNLKPLPIRLPIERYETLRKLSYEENRPMNVIVNEAIQQYLNERKNTPTD